MNINDFKTGDISGFDLAGWRLPDGKIELNASKEVINFFPKEIECNGAMYTLEAVIEGITIAGKTFVNAQYA